MELNIYTILYTLVIGLLGYFLRDLYNYAKKKTIRAEKPKNSLKYSYGHKMTSGTYPRMYSFNSSLIFKNIDTEPFYDITIDQIIDGSSNSLKSTENLNPGEKIKIVDKIEIPYGNDGSKPKEAEEKLPETFKNPDIIVTFINKNGHKYNSTLKK